MQIVVKMNFILRGAAAKVKVTALNNSAVKFYHQRVRPFIVTESRTLALVRGLDWMERVEEEEGLGSVWKQLH